MQLNSSPYAILLFLNFVACKQGVQNDTDWLVLNLGQFFTYVPHSDLAEFNISRVKQNSNYSCYQQFCVQ